MALNEKIITMDINTQYYKLLTVKNGDNDGARSLIIKLVNNNKPFDLTGLEVQVGAIKPDNTTVVNDCKILNAKDGRIELAFTTQMLAIAGILNMELNIIKERVRLSTIPFKVTVVPSISTYGELVSSNEFEVLADTMLAVEKIKQQQLQGYYTNIGIIRASVNPDNFIMGDTLENAWIALWLNSYPHKIYIDGIEVRNWKVGNTCSISFPIPKEIEIKEAKEIQIRVEDIVGHFTTVNLGVYCKRPIYVTSLNMEENKNLKYDKNFINQMRDDRGTIYQQGNIFFERDKIKDECVFYAIPESLDSKDLITVRVLSNPVDSSKEQGEWTKIASKIPFMARNGHEEYYCIYKSKNEKCRGTLMVCNEQEQQQYSTRWMKNI